MGTKGESDQPGDEAAPARVDFHDLDPTVLPLIAIWLPPDRIPLLLMLTEILGTRGGVQPPWLPLAEAVARALANRWPDLPDWCTKEIMQTLPRTVLYLDDAACDAIGDVDVTDHPRLYACLARRLGRKDMASALAIQLLATDDPFDREGLSLVVSLLEGEQRSSATDAIIADDSPVGLRGWMDLAKDDLLTGRDLLRIVRVLNPGSQVPEVVVAAELAPMLKDASHRDELLAYFKTAVPDDFFLNDWYQAAMLIGVSRMLDEATWQKWLKPMNEPYRGHVENFLAGPDETSAVDAGGVLRASPAGEQLRRYFDSVSPEQAATFAAQALDAVMDVYAGAGPPLEAVPPIQPPERRKKKAARKKARRERSQSTRPTSGARARDVPASDEPGSTRGRSTSGGPPAFDDEDAAESADEMSPPFEHTVQAVFDDEDAAAPAEETPPLERLVQAAILHQRVRRVTFVAGARNELICWIGPRDETDTRPKAESDEPVREDAVPTDGFELDVMLTCEGNSPQSGKLFLPKDPRLRSADCILPIDIPADEVHMIAELAFLHGGRAFEIVRIDAPVLTANAEARDDRALRIRTQVQRREDIELSDRAPVDGVVVASDRGLSVFGPRGAGRYTLQHTAKAVSWLNKEMFATEKTLVRRRAREDAESILDVTDADTLALFRDLAIHGNKLYGELVHEGFKDPGEHLQIFNMEPTAYVPLEFVYDRGHPVEGAGFCDGWEAALGGDDAQCGVCKPSAELTAEERDAMPTICPLGFWSLQKVIERHDSLTETNGGNVALPVDGGATLPPITSSLFASSHRVDHTDREKTLSVLRESFSHAGMVEDWDAWRQRIRDDAPGLIVALPHHRVESAMDALEIGSDSVLLQDRLSDLYVTCAPSGPGPVVILFGCETQVQAELGYVGFARDFARNRAAVVIGTLAKVLGRHAAPVAQSLVQELSLLEEPARLGVIMRRLRRRMLARGYLMALCLVALGDGDWQLSAAADRAR